MFACCLSFLLSPLGVYISYDRVYISTVRGHAAKKAFREVWQARTYKNIRGTRLETTTDRKRDQKESWYRGFAMIVQEEGGLVDLAGAITRARRIALKCEARGPPFVMYNGWTEEINYMHIKQGSVDTFDRSKSEVLAGDFEISPEALEGAKAEAEENGLSIEVPKELLGKCGLDISKSSQGSASVAQAADTSTISSDTRLAASAAPPTPILGMTPPRFPPTPVGLPTPVSQPPTPVSLPPTPLSLPPTPVGQAAGTLFAVKREPDDSAPKKRKLKKPMDTAFEVAQQHGKRLCQLHQNGSTIVQLAKTDDSQWAWAKNEAPGLQTLLESSAAAIETYNKTVAFGKVAHYVRAFPDEDSAIAKLATLTKSLTDAYDLLLDTIGPLMNMQNTRMNYKKSNIADASRNKGNKKAAAKAAAA